MELNPGNIIGGRYQIIRSIGRGGFGQTYLAKDQQQLSKPLCVIKQLRLENDTPQTRQEAERRFSTEVKTLERLGHHSQIPELLAHFKENQEFYLVQEFIKGENLKQEIKRRQRLNENDVIFLLQDVLEVLKFVHQQNVIHRDVKPDNLIRRQQDGKIVLIDFGAIKEISTLSMNLQGQPVLSIVIGTPPYTPPEQIDRHPRFSSDIYALGITAIEALLGECPQKDPETGEFGWQERVQVSPKLANILNRMIRAKYQERYSFVVDVLNDLQPLSRIGQTLVGQYKIIRYLGGGTFGHTYLAENQRRRARPLCVIKQIKPICTDLLTLQEAQHRFENEVKALEKLGDYDRIPRLLDHFEDNHEFYLVQEFIEGRVLSQEIGGGNRLNETQVIALLRDVLQSLQFIHQQGVIHRDIKPSNLIRRQQDGKIVLIDFGAVKEISTLSIDTQAQKASTQPLGTEGYMPPEQRDGQPKFSSDIYALGVTAIHALTGKSPNRFQKDVKTGELIWQEGVQVSPKLAKILDKMVRFNFKDRYQSASEVLKLLETISGTLVIPKKKFIISLIIIAISIFLWSRRPLDEIYARYNEANQLLDLGKYDESISLYNQVIKSKPNFTEALVNRGSALAKKGNHQDSLDSCKEATKIKPEDFEALICQGLAYQNLGNDDAALTAFNQALAVIPQVEPRDRKRNESTALNNRGMLYLSKMGKPEKAINDFKRAIDVDDSYYIAQSSLGQALHKQKEYSKAIEAFTKAIDKARETDKKDYEPAWIGRGNAYKELGQKTKALADYDKVTRINPNNYEAWYSRGLLQQEMRDFPQALYSYSQAIQVKPDYQAAIQAKERLLKLTGKQP
ncbi:protein kinase domain-containing protein [Floridanema evergladense]|uniref:non-specific serine/threonine protein kinase n=1 Tax=Floridaenema evergladense BLCC-F167 TaxID=3153639 RepID=A0ABV4WSF4_9CYAN